MSEMYKVNWIKTDKGNGINIGNTIEIDWKVDYISGGIYDETGKFPILAFFEMGNHVEIKPYKGKTWYGKAKPLPRGTYTLITRTGYGDGYTDQFEIV